MKGGLNQDGKWKMENGSSDFGEESEARTTNKEEIKKGEKKRAGGSEK
jgi:hypothetical protein